MKKSLKNVISVLAGAGILVIAFQNCAPGFEADSAFNAGTSYQQPPSGSSNESNYSDWQPVPPAYTDGQELANEKNNSDSGLGGDRLTTDANLMAKANAIDASGNPARTDFLGNRVYPIYLYSSDSYGDMGATSPSCNGYHRYYISTQKNGEPISSECNMESGPLGNPLNWHGASVKADTRAIQARLNRSCLLKTNTLYYVHIIKVSNFTNGCRSRFRNSSYVKNDLASSIEWKEAP